ncbi:MAG: AAA family ATPase [bacterium]|nr:AAA family ATPase [bacterium]
MDQLTKDSLREKAQKQIYSVQKNIDVERDGLQKELERLEDIIKGAVKGSHDEEDVEIEKILRYEKKNRSEELAKMSAAPYFSKCVVKFNREKEAKTVYFGRFPFFTDSIYSWVTPIAKLRYEEPGAFSFKSAEDEFDITGQLISKEQYMIVDGHIVFMAAESLDRPRELIYQERLTRKKSDFSLPEIVEQMEKAQDEVIRAHWKGSFLISGPAGSGKTTLALHRVAYLTQAPETEQLFPTNKIIVFVQDASTKNYFSKLLPELGIHKVIISTFEEWIIEKCNLGTIRFAQRYGRSEEEKDLYEYAKNKALKKLNKIERQESPFDLMRIIYAKHFTAAQVDVLERQIAGNTVDRFDLSLYVKHIMSHDGGLLGDITEYEYISHIKHKKTKKKAPVQYSLIVVDEAENYLQEQIEILLSCVGKKTGAMLYVGDLAQQTRTFTIKDWSSVGEQFGADRKVILQKVYRNTKQILDYINSVGFSVAVPNGIKEGNEVAEYVISHKAQEIEKAEELVENFPEGIVGILGKSDEYLDAYRRVFDKNKNVHVLTINEAQGVEFETVLLVGVDCDYFGGKNMAAELMRERSHVDHDLLYVALTRAMNQLCVLGREPLKKVVMQLR